MYNNISEDIKINRAFIHIKCLHMIYANLKFELVAVTSY